MKASTRVVINTSVQYARTGASVIISLFTTRVVLENLGVNDYGIFTLIGGVISMLAFVQGNIARSTQRFLSYYHGRKDGETIRIIFNNSLITQLCLSLVLCLTLLACTPLIFKHMVNIATEREQVAHYVYYIALVSLFFNFQSTPYTATLISRENLIYTTVVSFIDTLLKLPIAYSLILFSEGSRLTWYSGSIAATMILNYLCYRIYCRRKYAECKSMNLKLFRWNIAKEMFSFIGWGMYGTFCVVLRSQGMAVILNRFYSTAINAAYGLGAQIMAQMNILAIALTNAINPQIIKAEGGGNRKKMFRLSEISCKFSFLMLSLPAIPIIFYTEDILALWLNKVPDYTVMFARIIILGALTDQLTLNLNTANQAIGNIKLYTFVNNTIKLLTLPLAYIALKLGYGAMGAMLMYYCIEATCAVSRLILLKISSGLSIMSYFHNVFVRVLPPLAVNLGICYALSRVVAGWWFLGAMAFSALMTIVTIYFLSLSVQEKNVIDNLLLKRLHFKK